jgi:catechol 2,3-dioxygenase-like lactoylglutathione lyase family enzyme
MLAALVLMLCVGVSPAGAQALPKAQPTVLRVNLVTANPEGQKKFYTEVLGFKPIWEGLLGGDKYGERIANAWSLNPGSRLHGVLLEAPTGDTQLGLTYVVGQKLKAVARNPKKAPLAADHYLVVTVPDLNAVVEKMRPFNIRYNRPPAMMIDADNNQTYEMVIYDPEGTLLVVIEQKK